MGFDRRRLLFRGVLILGWIAVTIGLVRYLFPSNAWFRSNRILVTMSQHAQTPLRLLNLQIMPYTGYHHPSNVTEEGVFQGQPFKFTTNNYGFLSRYDLHPFDPPPVSGPRKRVVLVTGGSAAWGWGASSNETTFASVLERLLNEAGPESNWMVVNLAMGSWIAYQEYIALDLYGSHLAPEWVVTFDGRNDILVPTTHGELVPNYYMFGGQRHLNEVFGDAGDGASLPSFLRYRELARRIDRVASVPEEVTTTEEVDRAVRFYIHSLEAISRRFADSHVLLVTQPTRLLKGSYSPNVYKMGYEKFRPLVAALPGRYSNTMTYDASDALPEPEESCFVVDDCHLSDKGHEVIARGIAAIIIKNSK